ncbi:hypothetical protein SKAU_G00235440 [Synaphobranchus kaupii]|uniref:Uncharacterized protein n=1 Tax=Synaphobranchus kaupii TaxID=118154 RepID=A0A9Q1F6J5_SYNKA|nr:hypothetical protein SKAU_G00235440 [Synaphobranchus kaupii]
MRSELHSIESLLHDVLQRQSLLSSRLAGLQQYGPSCTESPAKSRIPSPSAVHPSSWASVAKKGRRISLPLFSPDDNPVPLSNSFDLLMDLTELAADCSWSAPQQPAQVRFNTTRKRQISPTTPLKSHGKRRRYLSPRSVSNSNSNSECSPPSLQPLTHLLNGALDTAVANGDVISSDAIPPSSHKALYLSG